MDLLRRLAAIILVVFTGCCVIAWGSTFNPLAFEMLQTFNPVKVEMFPEGDPMFVILGFGFGALALAYVIYPSNERRDRDDD